MLLLNRSLLSIKTKMNYLSNRYFLLVFIFLFFHIGCRQNTPTTKEEVIKFSVPTKILDIENIKPPISKTLKKPDVSSLGMPIKHHKLKQTGIQFINEDFEFVHTETIQLRPDHPKYPSTAQLHSQPTLAKSPNYGVNASDWKTVKKNYLKQKHPF